MFDPENAKIYDNPEEALNKKGEYRLSSNPSKKLIKKVRNGEFKN